jgi:3-methyladenine DNA glycosylase/8-oxoguanine DNA glycosylase
MQRRGVGRLTTKLRRRTEFEIVPLPPFDFGLTVRKPAGWDLFTSGEVYECGTLWTGVRFEGRSIGLKIQSRGTMEKPLVLVGAYAARGISGNEADRLREVLTVCLGAEQDLRDFYSFAMKDEILRHVVEDLYGMHDTQAVSLFNSVVLGICLQMARLARSREMMEAIDIKYGEAIEFDGNRLVLQPTAERIARLDPKSLAKECRLGYRARYIVASAKMIAGGFPDMLGIMAMPPDEAKEKLMELPGIGDYAADIINPHAGFPIDAWSVDVFGLLFFGKESENRREAIEEVKREGIRRWGRWSWMAFFYVAQDLRNLSKRLGIELRLD